MNVLKQFGGRLLAVDEQRDPLGRNGQQPVDAAEALGSLRPIRRVSLLRGAVGRRRGHSADQ